MVINHTMQLFILSTTGFTETYVTTVKTETIRPDGTRVIETRAVPVNFDN